MLHLPCMHFQYYSLGGRGRWTLTASNTFALSILICILQDHQSQLAVDIHGLRTAHSYVAPSLYALAILITILQDHQSQSVAGAVDIHFCKFPRKYLCEHYVCMRLYVSLTYHDGTVCSYMFSMLFYTCKIEGVFSAKVFDDARGGAFATSRHWRCNIQGRSTFLVERILGPSWTSTRESTPYQRGLGNWPTMFSSPTPWATTILCRKLQ